MTRYSKTSTGKYNIHGQTYEVLEGSRAQVWHGTAYKTSGGLKKADIMMNKNKRIVSKSKHDTARKEKRLVKAGYGTQKGKFGFVKLGQTKKSYYKHHARKSHYNKKHGGSSLRYSKFGGQAKMRGGQAATGTNMAALKAAVPTPPTGTATAIKAAVPTPTGTTASTIKADVAATPAAQAIKADVAAGTLKAAVAAK